MENSIPSIVVVGGGHAGVAMCVELAAAGLGKHVHLVCEESRLPYQRPPLSKGYLKSVGEEIQSHRSASWFADAGITVCLGDPAAKLDRTNGSLTLHSGATLPYAWLVLATGTVARRLPWLHETMRNATVLRSANDAERLRALLPGAKKVTVLGGGFVGLEIAATARLLGKDVVVFETAPRLLSRSVSPELAEHVLTSHRAAGIDIRVGVSIEGIEYADDSVCGLMVDGSRESVELLVVGIGAEPCASLAKQAGIACEDGILVDSFMRTSDSHVLAIGDVARFPQFETGERSRLESVQNANDQARAALATILGKPNGYRSLPWFWSDQGSMRLQMAGLVPSSANRYVRRGSAESSFSILHYVEDRLVCVESVNAPADHLAARKLLEAGISPAAVDAQDSSRPLKQFLSVT